MTPFDWITFFFVRRDARLPDLEEWECRKIRRRDPPWNRNRGNSAVQHRSSFVGWWRLLCGARWKVWRMIAYKDGEHVRLISRNGGDHTKPFGDPAAAVAKLSARTLLFDGEVAIFDQQPR